MKHILIASFSALVTGIITVSLYHYGAHDIGGFFAALAGYPGLLANGEHYTKLNIFLFTGVNWVFYFLLLEAVVALKRKFLGNKPGKINRGK